MCHGSVCMVYEVGMHRYCTRYSTGTRVSILSYPCAAIDEWSAGPPNNLFLEGRGQAGTQASSAPSERASERVSEVRAREPNKSRLGWIHLMRTIRGWTLLC